MEEAFRYDESNEFEKGRADALDETSEESPDYEEFIATEVLAEAHKSKA